MRVLVTGATGFLGSHVVRELVHAGHSVRAIERTASRRPLAPKEVEWVVADVLDPDSLAAAAKGCEAVVHAAAKITYARREFEMQTRVNVDGTRHMLEAARAAGVRRFVHTSSVATIGRPADGAVADEDTKYDWPVGLGYNESKRASELLVRAERGMETVCLNPALIFGPDDPTTRMLRLFQAARRGLVLVAPPGATTVCDVRDVARAHVTALERGTPGERYILGGPHVTYRELLHATALALGKRGVRAEMPELVVRLATLPLVAADRLGAPLWVSPHYAIYLMSRCFYSSARAERELDYHGRALEETLGDSVASYRAAGLL